MTTQLTENETKAVGLYVLLNYDPSDFADRLMEESPEVLSILYDMFTTPNSKMSEDNIKTNQFGLAILNKVLEVKEVKYGV